MCRGHPVSCVADKAAGLMGLPNRAGIEIDSQKTRSSSSPASAGQPILWVRHTSHHSTMAGKPQGYHNRQEPICSKIRSLLISLTKDPSKYDEIAPKVEYWIEYVLRHRFATVDELVEGVSGVAWDDGGPFSSIGRFLKEFNDAPHRSEQARSFVTQLPPYVLQWFAIASVEDLWTNSSSSLISKNGGPGFIRAASFIGSLIGWDLLNHELVRQHLTKPLTNHYDNHDHPCSAEATRANAIYQLFTAAGDNLLQGLIEAEDVQVCFNILNLRRGWITGLDLAKLQV